MSGLATLTAYFAERERSGGRFLADAMLDLLGDRSIATGVVLRGIASFGPTNIARSDRSLSLSEDPPVVVCAVDTADRVTAVADELAALTTRGVVTLARGDARPGTGWVRLSLYVGRGHRAAGTAGYVAACDVLHRCEFLGAEVMLGVDGTIAGQRRRARFFGGNADVPLLVSGVGRAEQAAAALDTLRQMWPDPLVTIEPVLVCKSGGRLLGTPADDGARWQKLTVRTAEDTLSDGRPIHRALIARLKDSAHASGATAVRGIWGFHTTAVGTETPHGDRFLQLTRHVPVTTVMVDTAPNIAASFEIVDALTERDGLVTCEPVPAAVAVDGPHRRGGLQLG
ncbi:DUF190 domain-containing protein [Mycolicibacterium sp.]|uniref:DUF190 domain-containing protein n=1 Tax=Mycolicibacterium sp. TaxID=2320850 RepID=UPI003D131640